MEKPVLQIQFQDIFIRDYKKKMYAALKRIVQLAHDLPAEEHEHSAWFLRSAHFPAIRKRSQTT